MCALRFWEVAVVSDKQCSAWFGRTQGSAVDVHDNILRCL